MAENADTFFKWKILDDESTTRIEYYDQSGAMVTPVPLYIPDPEELKILDKQSKAKSHNVMQTFMKMAGAVYTMAGLGTIEDSRFFKEKFDGMDGQDTRMMDFGRDDDQDSLAEEAEQALLRGVSGSKKAEFEADQGLGNDTDLDLEPEPAFDATFYSDDMTDGQSQRSEGHIDILLKESETLWMLILTGTCAEIEGDEQLQRKKRPSKDAETETEESEDKKATEKKERSDSVTQTEEEPKEGDDEEEQEATEEKEVEVTSRETGSDEVVEKVKVKDESVKKEEVDETLDFISNKYDLNARWSQTIDFPRKKKGTQTDMIATSDTGSQVVSKDLLFR